MTRKRDLGHRQAGTAVPVPMTFLVNGEERMRINTAGDLGVGADAISYGAWLETYSVQLRGHWWGSI